MRVRTIVLTAVVVASIAGVAVTLSRPKPTLEELRTMMNAPRPAIAMQGYDPVSYFDGAPKVGNPKLSTSWSGQQWAFTSEQHRQLFVASPARYAPAFDGHCAFAMSLGKVAPASPESWIVANDTLYLQQNAVARQLFRLLPGRIHKAQQNWARLKGK